MDKFKNKSEREWEKNLTREEYRILRERGTEEAFSGEYLDNKEDGTYACRGCGSELFSSDAKFDSGTGWPSFSDVIEKGNVLLQEDNSHGPAFGGVNVKRIEVTCANCGGHLGHVFPDGPTQTTKRYCINSVSLDFKEK